MFSRPLPLGDSIGSNIEIVIENRLQALALHVAVHRADAARIADFELLIARLALMLTRVFFFVVADARRNARRNLRRADLRDAVAERHTL